MATTITIPTLAWFVPLLIASLLGWRWLLWRFVFGPLDRWIQGRIAPAELPDIRDGAGGACPRHGIYDGLYCPDCHIETRPLFP